MLPGDISVLVVGAHEYGLQVAKELQRNGVTQFTLLDSDHALLTRAIDELGEATLLHHDPIALSAAHPEHFTTSHVIVALDQPRDFEVALDTLCFQNGNVPFVISRCAAYACKIRSAYRTVVAGGQEYTGESLHGPLEEYTDNKRARLAAIVKQLLPDTLQPVHLAGAGTASVLSAIPYFDRTPKSLASPESRYQVEAACKALAAEHELGDILPQALTISQAMCEKGFTEDPRVVSILAPLVAYEVLAVSTGQRPLNVVSVEEVFNVGL